jgi:hypothetical protein
MKTLKGIKTPKDGKTFCLNGRRFSTLQEAKDYANIHLDSWVSGTTTDGIFTYIDVVCYERQDQN